MATKKTTSKDTQSGKFINVTLLILLLVTWIGLGLFGTFIYTKFQSTESALNKIANKKPLQQPPLNDKLVARVNAIESRIDSLEYNSFGQDNDVQEGLSNTDAAALESLVTTPDVFAPSVDIISIPQPTPLQPASIPHYDANAALILATIQLQERIRLHLPFDNALYMLKTIAPDNDTVQDYIAQLSPYAETGVISYERLHQGFPTVSEIIYKSFTADQGEEGWKDRVITYLSEFITIKHTKQKPFLSDANNRLIRANNLMKSGNIKDTITLLESFPIEDKYVRDWMEDANTHVKVTDLMHQLYGYIIENPATQNTP